jgi:hypothetical protein
VLLGVAVGVFVGVLIGVSVGVLVGARTHSPSRQSDVFQGEGVVMSATPHLTPQRHASDAGEHQRGGDEAPRRGGRRKRRTCRQALSVSATTHGSLAGGTVGLLVE